MKHSVTWSQVLSFRLHRHGLAGQDRPTDPATVCRNIYGMQAQVMSAAELQFWTRMPGLHCDQIHSALWEKRSLIKSSLMRQTLHIIAAADFAICISALTASRMAVLQRIMTRYGNITQEETDEINAAILEALAAGPMTQPELKEKVLAITGKKIKKYMEYAWSIQLFRPALVQGLICYGPDQGKKSTFVRVDQWLPKQKKIAEQKAKQILLSRFLNVYGPATLADFCKWSGIGMREAKPVWTAIEKELVQMSVEGKEAWIHQEEVDYLREASPSVNNLRLLPYFDPYLLGHAETEHLLEPVYYKRVYRNQGWISPVILLGGKVVGTWSHKNRGKRLPITVEPFGKLTKAVRGKIEKEADRLGGFLGTLPDIFLSS
jgi:hypothetical protein